MVVRITGSGTSSDIPRVVSASYENDNMSANTLGIATTNITDGSQGFIITEGVLLGINTSNYTSGQLVYLGPTGSITGSAPQAPLHTVRLGQIIREQSNNGSMHVRIDNGTELGELHDVRDTTTTGSYGDLLVKSGSVWINSKQLTGSYGLTGSLIITGSTSGDLLRITQTGAGNSFIVEDSDNPDASPFVVGSTGNVSIGTGSTDIYKLDIVAADPQLRVYGTSNNRAFRLYPTNGAIEADNTSFYLNRTSTTNILLGFGGGNVGVGPVSSPAAKLDVSGSGRFTSNLTVTGSTQLTGSANLTGSLSIQGTIYVSGSAGIIDTEGVIWSNTSYQSILWNQRELRDSNSTSSLNWNSRKTISSNKSESIDWENRLLKDLSGIDSVSWDGRELYDETGNLIMSWTSPGALITGSLYGTSSWAQNTVTASYFSGSVSNATSASYKMYL